MRDASLRQKVYQSLRFDIVSGKIPGGTRLTENAIAQAQDVSRTPVREALQKLAQEKLILSIPKAGYIVEDLSDNDIQDLFSARMEIEDLAFHKALQTITVEELKALDDNLEQTKTAIRKKEDLQITRLDQEFHSILYRAARSKTIFNVCKNLSDLTMKYRHGLNLSAALAGESLQHHIAIYQAVLAKDGEKISRILSQHASQAVGHIMVMMQKQRSDAFYQDSI